MKTTREIQDWLIAHIAQLLNAAPDSIAIHEAFSSYGLSSLDVVTLSGDLEEFVGCRLSPTLAYDYPNIFSLAHFLGKDAKKQNSSSRKPTIGDTAEPVAVIGIACRFPGAKDPESFWQLLRSGVDAISEVPKDRWNKDAFYNPDPSVVGKSISCWGGFLDNIDRFDPFFFGISPAEAKQMDPQQRLLLELSHEALDDAGLAIENLEGSKTGVFIGISVNEYGLLQLANPKQISGHSGTGNALSIAANRISYTYNFHGPSIAIDTACSSSLAAVHLACQSLRQGESTMALAGGVNIILSPAHSIAFTKAGVLSPDGRCKTFDAQANGYVRGEGGGLVVLKLLSSALADGDPIHAVIRGSSMIQDGRTNGLIAPSREAQEVMLREAYRTAGVQPGTVHYVEAHGTGTILGDAMEAQALGAVMSINRTDGPCAIGSVKTNIGHLESAAGIAGLIKVILSLKNRAIPPNIHYNTANPHVPFSELHLRVNNELSPWPNDSNALLAGVSSFGFGGTNVHIVVQEATDGLKIAHEHEETDSRCHLLPLSGNNSEELRLVASTFDKFLSYDSSIATKDVVYAASIRRSQRDCRLALLGNSRSELRDGLQAFLQGQHDPNLLVGNKQTNQESRIAFVFSGQGGQWYGMGCELLQQQPVFYNAMQRIDAAMHAHSGWSVISMLCDKTLDSRLDEIDVVQPAIFAIQVALAELWQSWGITPDAVIGHSMGEIAAAHVAGVLSLEDAIRIVCFRSQLLKQLRGQGCMLVTELSSHHAEELIKEFDNNISLAVINGPASTVLSGNPETIRKVMALLESQNLFCKLLNVDVASHSSQVDNLRSELLCGLRELNPRTANIPIYSTVTGKRSDDLVFDADYWMDNLRKPVLFFDAVTQLLESGYSTFIEVGPHPVLLGSIQQSTELLHKQVILLPSLRREEPAAEVLFHSLALLYIQGFSITWEKLYASPGKYVPLPMLPWQRQRYWIDVQSADSNFSCHQPHKTHPLLGDRINLANSPTSFVWQTTLDNAELDFLSDHRIANEIIFPAAAYIEMALQCAEEIGLVHSHTLYDLDFKESMVLQLAKVTTIQSILSPQEKNSFTFCIYSRTSEEEKWMLHASARFTQNVRADDVRVSPERKYDVIRQQGKSQYTSEEFYKTLRLHGIAYGPSFRAIRQLWSKDDESLGHVALPEPLQNSADLYQIHPVLLDACLQVVAAALPGSSKNNLYLPTGCKQIKLFGRPGKVIWSHVSLRPESEASGVLHADIRLFDNDGLAVAELIGFRLQRTNRHRTHLLSHQDTWLYEQHWQIKRSAATPSLTVGEGKHWLILADNEGIGQELSKQLQANGGHCHLLRCAETLETLEDETSFADLLENILHQISSPLYGVIHLWSVSTPAPCEDLYETSDAQFYDCESALYLVKALAKHTAALPHLWLVTRGAQSVNVGERIAVEQSPLWGLGKVISFELPLLKCVRIDLDPQQPVAQTVSLLLKEISVNETEDQIAFRDGVRFVLRLRPTSLARSFSSTSKTFAKDGTYLITGGLGGLGLKTAEWMAQRGARHLVLLGRSNPSSSAMHVVEQMRHQGIQVVIAQMDVSDSLQLQRVLDKIRNNMPMLRGVIHAAGVLDDASLLNLSSERMRKVMLPKLNGTWNLHHATLNFPLDFFVLFSSAVSVLGSPGQGNYAAASAYLDAFAHFRRNLGLPAISINWGPWAEVGLAAEATERLKARNASTEHLIKVIEFDQGFEILGQLISEPMTQITVLPFDLKNLIELYPMAAGLPFLETVGGSDVHVARLYARPKLRQQYMPPRNEVERKLAQLWQQTLHIDQVGVHDSFFELGGDSVLAAQVLTLVQKSFGIRINPQEAFKTFTIEKLAIELENHILLKIEEMSEDEAKELLSKGN